MSDLRIHPLVLDRGIVSITHAQPQSEQALPQGGGDALLPDRGVQSKMDQLLRQPTIDGCLDAYLRPPLENRDLLRPAGSRAALQACRQQLSAAAQSHPQGSPAARELARAARLLGEEHSLRDLAQTLRSALYQG